MKKTNRPDEEVFCLAIKQALLDFYKYQKQYGARSSNHIELYDANSWEHLGSMNREHLMKAKRELPKLFKNIKI